MIKQNTKPSSVSQWSNKNHSEVFLVPKGKPSATRFTCQKREAPRHCGMAAAVVPQYHRESPLEASAATGQVIQHARWWRRSRSLQHLHSFSLKIFAHHLEVCILKKASNLKMTRQNGNCHILHNGRRCCIVLQSKKGRTWILLFHASLVAVLEILQAPPSSVQASDLRMS